MALKRVRRWVKAKVCGISLFQRRSVCYIVLPLDVTVPSQYRHAAACSSGTLPVTGTPDRDSCRSPLCIFPPIRCFQDSFISARAAARSALTASYHPSTLLSTNLSPSLLILLRVVFGSPSQKVQHPFHPRSQLFRFVPPLLRQYTFYPLQIRGDYFSSPVSLLFLEGG